MAVFEDLNAGLTVETLVTRHGIPARTSDDKFFRRFLFLRPPRVTFRVQVRPADLIRAQNFLHDTAANVLRPAIHCPDCDSLRVSYPQMTRKFIMPTILLHAGILLRLIDHQCYCENCHHLWSLPGEATGLSSKVSRDPWPNPF